jgi:hypothetical protein
LADSTPVTQAAERIAARCADAFDRHLGHLSEADLLATADVMRALAAVYDRL